MHMSVQEINQNLNEKKTSENLKNSSLKKTILHKKIYIMNLNLLEYARK